MRYIVQPGDTLYSIARRFNTTVDALLAANPSINTSFIYPGQIIMIPTTTMPPTGFYYTVQPGDTLYGIATRFNANLRELILINGIREPYIIYPGQRLFIPGVEAPQPPTGGQVYIIQPGDTLYSIAEKFNVSMEEIIRLNNISRADLMYPGQRLLIPPQT